MKKELLAPAGNLECAYAAINSGADAIYIGGKNFGARSFASNFLNEEIKEIVHYAHLRRVKVYVTVNTLISDANMDNAIEFVRYLNSIFIDAIIVQDIGLALKVHGLFPDLEMHSSTQMHSIDKNSFKFLKSIGFKRVVVARELSLKEINEIDSNLEIEAFIHGAMCISYSGECLMSAMNKGFGKDSKEVCRSGNLGGCAQLCRMPYTLSADNKELNKGGSYLLSPKDLRTVDKFNEVMKSNITSLKIEGRMKSVSYVSLVTSIYRKLIDSYYDNTKCDITYELEKLDYLFNRGYSGGYILEDSKNLMNTLRGNHKGVLIGKVIDVTKRDIIIKLEKTLKIKDGIKFESSDKGLTVYNMYKLGVSIKVGYNNDIISIPNNILLNECENVLKTYDDLLNEQLCKVPSKKMEIDVFVKANIGSELEVTFKDVTSGYSATLKTSDIVSRAINKEVSKEDLLSKLSKLGSDAYKVRNFIISDVSGIFIPISQVNDVRRRLVSMLDETILNSYKKSSEVRVLNEDNKSKLVSSSDMYSVSVFVRTKEQYEIVSKYNVKRIYTDNKDLLDINGEIYYEVNIVDKDVIRCSEDILYKNILVNSTSDVIKYSDRNLVFNYTMNLYNSSSLEYFTKKGIPTLSVELSLDTLSNIDKSVIGKCELLVYGKPRVMTMKHCLINDVKSCSTCKLSKTTKVLKDAFGREYKVVCSGGINYIYNYEEVDMLSELKNLEVIGIKHLRIDFLEENENEVVSILSKINEKYFL